MTEYRLISADSHVNEPPNLWVERVDQKYRERAPQLMVNPPGGKEGAYFYYEGYAPHPIGIGFGAGKSPEELKTFLNQATYADARPGGWDPAERKKDNAIDGVEADVLYTTLGFRIFWLKDAGLQADCFRVYNDWLAEFVSYDPDKMAGLAMISLYDPKAGARELERCAKMGLKGAMIWCSPPQEQPYSSDVYDPFWAAAQELNMPISLHAITGMGVESQWNWGERYMRSTVLAHEVEKSFSVLIFSGVLGREQCRLDPLFPAAHGPVRRALARPRGQAEAERIFPAADVGHLHLRLCRGAEPPVHRRRPDDVVVRLPAPGLVLAAFAGGRRPRLQGRQRRGHLQDHPRQRRPALWVCGVEGV